MIDVRAARGNTEKKCSYLSTETFKSTGPVAAWHWRAVADNIKN